MNQSKYEINDRDLTFDFDEWTALFKADPEAFNLRCSKWNKAIINSAPKNYRRRLNGLLFQINMERTRSKNALDSCIRLSAMMWDAFNQFKLELKQLDHKSSIPPPEQIFRPIQPAQILAFPVTQKARKNK